MREHLIASPITLSRVKGNAMTVTGMRFSIAALKNVFPILILALMDMGQLVNNPLSAARMQSGRMQLVLASSRHTQSSQTGMTCIGD
jgi:hypothetical protein